jgi:DNA mismatch endonuclease (patch repair protein)
LLMARIRSSGNVSTEIAMATALREIKVTGWRRHRSISLRANRVLPRLRRGRKATPDFVFPREKVAVFVDGCFWHACPRHGTKPRSQNRYWRLKLEGNVRRDHRVNKALRSRGWRVVRIWEHSVVNDSLKCARRVQRSLQQAVTASTGTAAR